MDNHLETFKLEKKEEEKIRKSLTIFYYYENKNNCLNYDEIESFINYFYFNNYKILLSSININNFNFLYGHHNLNNIDCYLISNLYKCNFVFFFEIKQEILNMNIIKKYDLEYKYLIYLFTKKINEYNIDYYHCDIIYKKNENKYFFCLDLKKNPINFYKYKNIVDNINKNLNLYDNNLKNDIIKIFNDIYNKNILKYFIDKIKIDDDDNIIINSLENFIDIFSSKILNENKSISFCEMFIILNTYFNNFLNKIKFNDIDNKYKLYYIFYKSKSIYCLDNNNNNNRSFLILNNKKKGSFFEITFYDDKKNIYDNNDDNGEILNKFKIDIDGEINYYLKDFSNDCLNFNFNIKLYFLNIISFCLNLNLSKNIFFINKKEEFIEISKNIELDYINENINTIMNVLNNLNILFMRCYNSPCNISIDYLKIFLNNFGPFEINNELKIDKKTSIIIKNKEILFDEINIFNIILIGFSDHKIYFGLKNKSINKNIEEEFKKLFKNNFYYEKIIDDNNEYDIYSFNLSFLINVGLLATIYFIFMEVSEKFKISDDSILFDNTYYRYQYKEQEIKKEVEEKIENLYDDDDDEYKNCVYYNKKNKISKENENAKKTKRDVFEVDDNIDEKNYVSSNNNNNNNNKKSKILKTKIKGENKDENKGKKDKKILEIFEILDDDDDDKNNNVNKKNEILKTTTKMENKKSAKRDVFEIYDDDDNDVNKKNKKAKKNIN